MSLERIKMLVLVSLSCCFRKGPLLQKDDSDSSQGQCAPPVYSGSIVVPGSTISSLKFPQSLERLLINPLWKPEITLVQLACYSWKLYYFPYPWINFQKLKKQQWTWILFGTWHWQEVSGNIDFTHPASSPSTKEVALLEWCQEAN